MNFNPFKKKKEDVFSSGAYGTTALNSLNTSTGGAINKTLNTSKNNYNNPIANSLLQGNGLPQTKITGNKVSIPSFEGRLNTTRNLMNNSPVPSSKAPSVSKVEQSAALSAAQSGVPSYMAGYQNLADQKKSLLDKQNQQGKDYYNKSYDERSRLLNQQIPQLQEQFARTSANVQKGIDSNRQTAEYNKQNVNDEWGTTQRLAAQTRGESEARNRNKFAALGTTSSYGAGSYGQAQENVESDFNRFTQEGLRGKEQNMFEIDKALQNYEIDAQTNLDNLDMQLTSAVQQIQSNININDLDKQNAIDELFNSYQTAVLGVEEGMQGIYKEYYDAQAATTNSGLSFDEAGNPQNQASYEWMLKNPDDYKSSIGTSGSQNNGKVQGIVEQLSGMNTKGITGRIRGGWSDESRSAEGLLNQLNSELQIEEAARLKGQGSMSDAERSILANSVAALNLDKNGKPRVDDARFKQILSELYQQFGGQGQAPLDIDTLAGQF